ncbi:MAG: PQQ-dependent sugar dehydrogenase [Chloroflexota bacterium]
MTESPLAKLNPSKSSALLRFVPQFGHIWQRCLFGVRIFWLLTLFATLATLIIGLQFDSPWIHRVSDVLSQPSLLAAPNLKVPLQQDSRHQVGGNTIYVPLLLSTVDEEDPQTIDWPEVALNALTPRFSAPVQITHAGDDSGRLFVVERRGTIQIIENGQTLSTPFLDISSRVTQTFECGLLSIAFPTSFADDGYFFAYYNHREEQIGPTDEACDTIIARFKVTEDPNVADSDSEEQILIVDQPHANHNGGQIQFGPDTYLYVGLGDGGSGGDPDELAQNTGTLLGKMLRLEVGVTGAYTVPVTNPFVGDDDYLPEIWATGLRNPWRFSFDRGTGDLYMGDVGQNAYEEISWQPAGSQGGENYGWDVMEANHCFEPAIGCDQSGLTLPIWEYSQSQGDRSVTGGYVYRGTEYQRMQGVYFYGDYSSGRLWALQQHQGVWQNQLMLDTSYNIVSFGEDEEGNLYLVDINGGIYRLSDVGTTSEEDPNPTEGLEWDPRLDQREALFIAAEPTPGSGYWKLIQGLWLDEEESEGRHHIYVDTLDVGGERQTDVPILVSWPDGSTPLLTEAKPGEPHAADFGMFSIAPAYAVVPNDGNLADSVDGLGMGTIEEPHLAVHTSYRFTWQWTIANSNATVTSLPTTTSSPTATPSPSATSSPTGTLGMTPTAASTSTPTPTLTNPPASVPTETATPSITTTSTSTSIPTNTPTFTSTPPADATPTATPVINSVVTFHTGQYVQCEAMQNGTVLQGTVYVNGQPEAGHRVVFSHESGGVFATEAQSTRSEPLGFYDHLIGVGFNREGNWFTWIIDELEQPISAIVPFTTDGGNGPCNRVTVNFYAGN